MLCADTSVLSRKGRCVVGQEYWEQEYWEEYYWQEHLPMALDMQVFVYIALVVAVIAGIAAYDRHDSFFEIGSRCSRD